MTRADVSNEAFKFMDAKQITIGMVDCLVQRVSYTGDLGYEIFCDFMKQRSLWHTLWNAGQDLGIRPFGMRAMMSLRLDKFFGSWAREFSPDYFPGETGIDRFIRWNKPVEWIGKAAATKEKAEGPKRKLCAFVIEAGDADVVAYEPLWIGDKVVGFCSSGGYSHWTGKSVAQAFVPVELIKDGLVAEIEILGERRKATMVTGALWDGDGARMRG